MRKLIVATACAVSLLLTPVLAEDRKPTVPRGAVVHQVGADEDAETLAKLYGVSLTKLESLNAEAGWSEGDMVVVPRPEGGWPTHTVRPGETLWRIGKGYGISVEQLREANSMGDNSLMPGNVLVLPRAVKPVWSLPDPAPVNYPAASVGSPATQSYGSAAPVLPVSSAKPAPRLVGTWVEVRLPDNRRAWAQVDELVVGSWQPQAADRVIEVGRSFVGVPYKWGGVDPNGWDCSGFIQEVFRLAGHQVPRLADAQYEACAKVSVGSLVPGDMVFFNTDGSGVSHVGIYTGNGRFLHASSSRGVVEDRLDDSYFSTRYYGAGRLPAWDTMASKSEDKSTAVSQDASEED